MDRLCISRIYSLHLQQPAERLNSYHSSSRFRTSELSWTVTNSKRLWFSAQRDIMEQTYGDTFMVSGVSWADNAFWDGVDALKSIEPVRGTCVVVAGLWSFSPLRLSHGISDVVPSQRYSFAARRAAPHTPPGITRATEPPASFHRACRSFRRTSACVAVAGHSTLATGKG